MPKLIIADTSCLIVLEKIGRLRLLRNLFQVVTVTPEVQAEYGSELPEWIEVISLADKSRQQLFERELDPGEASAIALAMEHPGSLLLIDERKGRKVAQDLQLSITGTLGILIRGKERHEVISLADEIVKLRKVQFRMSETLIARILEKYEPEDLS